MTPSSRSRSQIAAVSAVAGSSVVAVPHQLDADVEAEAVHGADQLVAVGQVEQPLPQVGADDARVLLETLVAQ